MKIRKFKKIAVNELMDDPFGVKINELLNDFGIDDTRIKIWNNTSVSIEMHELYNQILDIVKKETKD
jgi:hypothetical protein